MTFLIQRAVFESLGRGLTNRPDVSATGKSDIEPTSRMTEFAKFKCCSTSRGMLASVRSTGGIHFASWRRGACCKTCKVSSGEYPGSHNAGPVHGCCRRWRRGSRVLCGAQSPSPRSQVVNRLQGFRGQERGLDLRGQSRPCGSRSGEYRGARAQYRRVDQHWARACGQWIENVYYPELEEAGLYLRRGDKGQVVTSPGKIRSIAANLQGNSGVPFMDLRRKRSGFSRVL